MVQSPLNNVVVKIKHKFTEGITGVAKLAAIQNLSSINIEDYVTITGDVVSPPLEISKRREYAGYGCSDIKPGDTAIFSYSVVSDMVQDSPETPPKFKNSFWYNGAEYFNCDILRLFAVIRDGEIRMQNGYVMLSEIEKPALIFLPNNLKKTVGVSSGVVSAIGDPLNGCKKVSSKVGDTVFFNPNVVQSYKINGKPFYIIPQHHILGTSVTGLWE